MNSHDISMPGGQLSHFWDKMSLARDTGHRGSIPGRSRPFRDGWQAYINSVRQFSALFNNSIDLVCIHFTIFLRFTFTAVPWSESELTIPGTKVPGNICSQERKFPGTFVTWSESSRELSFLGEEGSHRGPKILGSEKS